MEKELTDLEKKRLNQVAKFWRETVKCELDKDKEMGVVLDFFTGKRLNKKPSHNKKVA